jgi:hypothetical protein
MASASENTVGESQRDSEEGYEVRSRSEMDREVEAVRRHLDPRAGRTQVRSASEGGSRGVRSYSDAL